MQALVKLPRVPRRLLQLALAPRCANRRAQPLRFSVRVRSDECSQRFVVVKQLVAPRFGPVHQRHCGARLSGDCLEGRTNGVGIDSAHQFAEILHVPSPRFMTLYSVGKVDRFTQFIGQIESRKLIVAQLDQLHSERLQRVHLPLALGFAGSFGVVRRRFHIVSYHTKHMSQRRDSLFPL